MHIQAAVIFPKILPAHPHRVAAVDKLFVFRPLLRISLAPAVLVHIFPAVLPVAGKHAATAVYNRRAHPDQRIIPGNPPGADIFHVGTAMVPEPLLAERLQAVQLLPLWRFVIQTVQHHIEHAVPARLQHLISPIFSQFFHIHGVDAAHHGNRAVAPEPVQIPLKITVRKFPSGFNPFSRLQNGLPHHVYPGRTAAVAVTFIIQLDADRGHSLMVQKADLLAPGPIFKQFLRRCHRQNPDHPKNFAVFLVPQKFTRLPAHAVHFIVYTELLGKIRR